MSNLRITPATLEDWPAIEAIYREGIRTGQATFQTEAEVPDGASWFAAKMPDMIFAARADWRRAGLDRPFAGIEPLRLRGRSGDIGLCEGDWLGGTVWVMRSCAI